MTFLSFIFNILYVFSTLACDVIIDDGLQCGGMSDCIDAASGMTFKCRDSYGPLIDTCCRRGVRCSFGGFIDKRVHWICRSNVGEIGLVTENSVWDKRREEGLLKRHNYYRTRHGVLALSWNETLAIEAKRFAGRCQFIHSADSGYLYGENLGWGRINAEYLIDAWYNEIFLYDFDTGEYSESTGHATQMLWASTKSLGCGVEACFEGEYEFLVCRYYPIGNIIGQFVENVFRF